MKTLGRLFGILALFLSFTIPAQASFIASGYKEVQDEGTPLAKRTKINFAGAGVTCADTLGVTTCTISGGGVAGLTDSHVFVGNVSNVATDVAMSGDVTISNTGVTTVANDSHAHTSTTLSGIDISDDTNLSGNAEVVLTGDALSIASTITRDTEWDTIGEIETATGVNIIVSTEIDTSAEIASLVTDETGTGALVFAVSPVFTTPNIGSATGSITGNAGTATALAADGANCTAGNFPLGVDASGAVQGCTANNDTLDDLSNNVIDDLSDVIITTDSAAQILVRNAGDTAYENVSVSGDASITAAGVVAVSDDSHAHTSSTISGIDISADTNLAATSPIVLTNDTLSLSQNAGTDVTADLEEETHATEHAIGGADEVQFYGEVQDETSALTRRRLLNFAGAGVSCADDTTKTTCTIPGAGSATITVEEDNVTVSASISDIDFGSGFDVTESPVGEANVSLDLSEAASGGDITWTVNSPAVNDDSHAHTGTTLSGIDISDDTNLAGNAEIVLTGDSLSIAASITRDTEWDTIAEIETATGVNIIVSTEIDTSAELRGVLTDENGTGVALFNDATTPNFVTDATVGGVSVCLEDGTNCPAGATGDITSVGNVTSGAAFDGTQGTQLVFNDVDGDGTLIIANLTAVRTWTLPDRTGTVILSGDTVSGDVTGTLENDGDTVLAVVNDSHSHTGSTISGIDISDDTNLAGDAEIVLTGDTLSIAASIARDAEVVLDSEFPVLSTTPSDAQILIYDTVDSRYENKSVSGDITIVATGVATIGANTVALTTDTTGNYAAGDAEAGAALTGDSATAFFSTGTLEDARLSTNVIIAADTFSGDVTATLEADGDTPLTIAANSVALTTDTTGNYVASVATTSPLTGGAAGSEGGTLTLSITANGITATEIDETSNYTFTGALINQGTNPTVDATGEIGQDTTNNQLIYGATPFVLDPKRSKTFRLDDTTAADDNFLFWNAEANVTVTDISCKYSGTGSTPATFTLEDDDGNAMTISGTNPTCTAEGTESTFASVTAGNALLSGEGIRIDVTNTPAPTTDDYIVTIKYTTDRT